MYASGEKRKIDKILQDTEIKYVTQQQDVK